MFYFSQAQASKDYRSDLVIPGCSVSIQFLFDIPLWMLSVREKEFDQFVNWDLKSERFKGQPSDKQEGHSFFPFLNSSKKSGLLLSRCLKLLRFGKVSSAFLDNLGSLATGWSCSILLKLLACDWNLPTGLILICWDSHRNFHQLLTSSENPSKQRSGDG